MSDDLLLFGDDEPAVPRGRVSALAPIADWQVDLLRKALDARGLSSMTGRQEAIGAATGRPVESLRALTHDEAMRVLTSFGQAPVTGRRTTSTWDDRDGDTWIDRL